MISTRINTFLANFHYLNSKSKRAGCGLFCNKPLTHALEKEAKSLQDSLKELAASNVSDLKKSEAFFKRVEGSFNQVEAMRTKYGKVVQPKKEPPINMVALDGTVTKHVKKKPYQPGNFETQLVQALNEVNNSVANDILAGKISAEDAQAFQGQCNALIAKISSFKPQETCYAEVTTKASSRA